MSSTSTTSSVDLSEISNYLNQWTDHSGIFADPPLIMGDVTNCLRSYLHPSIPSISTQDEIWFWDGNDSRNLTHWAVLELENLPIIIINLEEWDPIYYTEFSEDMCTPLKNACSPILNVSYLIKRSVIKRIFRRHSHIDRMVSCPINHSG
jgi:hypothetical protein